MGDAGGGFAQEVVLAWRDRRLDERQCDEGHGRADERGCVDHRDDVAAEGGEEPGSGDRRDDPKSFAHRLQHAVRLTELLVRQHRLQHRGACGGEDVAAEAVEQRHDVEQPEIRAAVHEQQQAHHGREGKVRPDHQTPFREPVDDDPAERGHQTGQSQEEEDDPGFGVRSGQNTGPDPEGDVHRPVAEHRQELPAEEKADVPAAENRAHASP